jgi:hypothetical protein
VTPLASPQVSKWLLVRSAAVPETATREARARAKIHLVDIIRNAAKTNANHAQWLLERSWPNEYARTERIEQVGEKRPTRLVAGYSTT